MEDSLSILFFTVVNEHLIELNNFLEYTVKNLTIKEAIKILNLAYKHRYAELLKDY